MKYQSDIIHEILEQRGHKKSSLHYQTECIEKWIEETKGAYPKLTDYQAEWLSYINKIDGGGTEQPDPEPPIGEFPYVTLRDVTEATVDNVVPYAYKSAILKGQTLVNLLKSNINDYIININPKNWSVEDGYLKCVSTTGWHTISDRFNNMIKPSTKYLIVVEIKENTLNIDINFDGFDSTLSSSLGFLTFEPNEVGTKKVIVTTKPTISNVKNGFFRLPLNIPSAKSIFKFRVMAIEYQDGMENWDITYFEGMQSVQMPVLTTSNEDGTKTNILTVNEDVTLRSNGSVYDELDLLTGKLTQRIDEDGSVLTQEVVKTVDLSITDESGNKINHFIPIEGTMRIQTDGKPVKPTVSLEIPVEAITQNLASFIEGE